MIEFSQMASLDAGGMSAAFLALFSAAGAAERTLPRLGLASGDEGRRVNKPPLFKRIFAVKLEKV